MRRKEGHDQRFEAVRPNQLWHLDFLHRYINKHRHQILDLYQAWEGTFTAFGRWVREEHRLNYGDTAIRSLLQDAGLLRRGTSKSVTQDRGSYRKLSPGAQWLGDGSTMKVHCLPVQ